MRRSRKEKRRLKKGMAIAMSGLDMYVHPPTQIDALRALLDFERVNSCDFDPSDPVHRITLAGKAHTAGMIQGLKALRP